LVKPINIRINTYSKGILEQQGSHFQILSNYGTISAYCVSQLDNKPDELKIMKTLSKYVVVSTIAILGVVLPSQSTTYDVTTVGSSAGPVGLTGAYFYGIDPQSTGTGVIDPFLREQNNGTEMGVNTSAGTPFDDKGGPWTHDLAISQLQATTIGGVSYYQFYLDANQIGNATISLTTLKIFTSAAAATTLAGVTAIIGGVPVYNLGANIVNITGNNGSGSGDMRMDIPAALIGTTGYLYLQAGFDAPYNPNDGFEEWRAVSKEGTIVFTPDAGSTVAMLGMALIGLAGLRAKFNK